MTERRVSEAIIEMIVDVTTKEFRTDGDARLRIYVLIAENLQAMVRVLRTPTEQADLAFPNEFGVESDG